MKELWKPVQEYEGRLEVSNAGRVRTLPSVRVGIRNGKPHPQKKAGVVLAPFIGNNGYLHVAPKFGAERKKLLVHRLVAKAFVPGYFDKATVNHKNGAKLDNSPANLEWITLGENTAHQWETGLVNIRGERHPSAILSDDDVHAIRARPNEPAQALGKEFGVSKWLIYKIRQGKKKGWLA